MRLLRVPCLLLCDVVCVVMLFGVCCAVYSIGCGAVVPTLRCVWCDYAGVVLTEFRCLNCALNGWMCCVALRDVVRCCM